MIHVPTSWAYWKREKIKTKLTETQQKRIQMIIKREINAIGICSLFIFINFSMKLMTTIGFGRMITGIDHVTSVYRIDRFIRQNQTFASTFKCFAFYFEFIAINAFFSFFPFFVISNRFVFFFFLKMNLSI